MLFGRPALVLVLLFAAANADGWDLPESEPKYGGAPSKPSEPAKPTELPEETKPTIIPDETVKPSEGLGETIKPTEEPEEAMKTTEKVDLTTAKADERELLPTEATTEKAADKEQLTTDAPEQLITTIKPGEEPAAGSTATENGLEFDCNIFPDGRYAVDSCSPTYIVCKHNKLSKKECPKHEVFDEDKGRCNLRRRTTGCQPDAAAKAKSVADARELTPEFEITLNGIVYECDLPEESDEATNITMPNLNCRPSLTKKVSDEARVRSPQELNDTYDYVIVGGGTAGCVLANRLSEDSGKTVLVLEAGGEEDDYWFSQIPGFLTKLQLTSFDWQYMTTPQTNCCSAMINNQIRMPRGKGLGGCSSHNFLDAVRTSSHDFNRWAYKHGNKLWDYESVLPYFKKLENMQIPSLQSRANIHGYDGPISINSAWTTVLGRKALEAAKRKGFPMTDDYNDGKMYGFAEVQTNVDKQGRRVSAAKAYLRPAMNRPNLHVTVRALVSRVLFDIQEKKLPKAVGVEYLFNGVRHIVKAKEEIIVSGGAINTPQILMLSGIGPKKHLESYNIPVLVPNHAVGLNLHDHITSYLLYQANKTADSENIVGDTINQQLRDYFINGSGPLTTSGTQMKGFLRSGLRDDEQARDSDMVLYMLQPFMYTGDIVNMKPEAIIRHQVDDVLPFGLMVHTKTNNSGSIRLQSADPTIHPLITLNYLEKSDVDLDVLVKGMKIMINLLKEPQFEKYNIRFAEKATLGCEKLELLSDEYLKCSIRNRLFSLYQQQGSCRMGRKPHNSVVDQKLRVHGVTNLRVVDASIIPEVSVGKTHLTTMMIAERAADFIKERSKNE